MKVRMAVGTALALMIAAAIALGGGSILGGESRSAGSGGGAAPDEEVLTLLRSMLEEGPEDSALVSYYERNDARILWLDGGEPGDPAGELLDALEGVEAEGIDPGSLGLPSLKQRWQDARSGALDRQAAAELELALSRGFVAVARSLLQGSEPDGEQEVTWDLDREEDPGAEALRRVETDEVSAVLDDLRPTLEVYQATVEALTRYRERQAARGGWLRVTAVDEAATPGDTLPVVAAVRERLREGMDPTERRLAGDGGEDAEVLDPDLAAALAHFQGRHGLVVDSVIGPETVQALNVPLEQRIDELRLNLDRIRRLPRDFGERAVLVNIAGFELRVLEDNRPTLSMAVVVGQPSWRTTVFRDEIDHLVVNPYWHVPESIEKEELLPTVREDRDHLADQNISLVPHGDNFGEPVATDTIDWARVDPDDFPYDFRQEPGPRNALGRVKFMFPNPHNIYLHDTPADRLFERDFRAFSHGCVRVEHPMELARYLLETSSEMDGGDLERILASGERTRVDLQDPVPVYLAYLTTWVEEGTVFFHQDIYNFDEASMQ